MRDIFPEKSFTKCGEETSPRPYSEKSKLSISLDQYSKVLYNLFLLYAKLRAIKICCRALGFTSYKAFLKNKKRYGTNLPGLFYA